MSGLVWQIPAPFPTATYVKIHLFPGDKPGDIGDRISQPLDPSEARSGRNHAAKPTAVENQQNHKASVVQEINADADGHLEMDTKMIDLNMKPHRIQRQASNNQIVASD